jgi:von Willebrand factor type A domain
MKCDTHNIDAQRGGDCVVLCQVSANYTQPPSNDRSRGFDGIILFDTALDVRKLTLAMEAAATIIDATSSNDRLGLVVFGDIPCTISELIMCTTPYKQALQQSIHEITSTESNNFSEGMKLAVNLLAKDSRYGGHVFLISDGKFIPPNVIPPSNPRTTIHTIAIGELIHPTTLRCLRTSTGSFLQFRSASHDSLPLSQLTAYQATQIHAHSIDTIRCRLIYHDKVTIQDIPNTTYSQESTGHISLTLGTPLFNLINSR